ncbi:MAG: FAD-binding protein [Nitrosopumilus sp.]|nr:FAD-binding protein [Nitrosopumilus sp.]
MSAAQMISLNTKVFQTVHKNFIFKIDDLFEARNGDHPDMMTGYNETTSLIQDFFQKALNSNKQVRSIGGNWSWTTVGFTKGWMISTLKLNRIKLMPINEINQAIEPFEKDRYLFAQCGCSVIELNHMCQRLNRSLPTTGASNGQTIAGLISNGTHGASLDFGSTPEFVVGLHLILSPNKHVYLERASRPIVTNDFIQRIGAVHIKDDRIFNAALVSFGSFGFIHGVMIETVPLFLYNSFRKQFSITQIGPLLNSLDFSQADFLPRPNVRPYHFQAIVNPHDTRSGPYISIMYKELYHPNYDPIVIPNDEAGPGEDAPVLLGKLTDIFPVLTASIVNTTLKQSYKDRINDWGTHGEIFNASLARGKVLSCAIGIAAENTTRVLDIAVALNKKHKYVGVFAFRFVKQTKATLGFTKFPNTCVAEFDSFEAKSTWKFYHALWDELDNAGIPYTFHWGKVNNLNAQKIRGMYGNKVNEWISARLDLIPEEMLPVLTNEFMVTNELDRLLIA